jgi:glycosyl transferase family 25
MSKYIDKIIYINLDRRTDRRQDIENELLEKKLSNYERYSAIETPSFGALGCCLSHLNILKIAKERNYKNVLILEDDFMFLVSKEEVEKNLTKLFEGEVLFDVCMLSYKLLQCRSCEKYPFLLKALNIQTASGYIVNHLFYDKLIENLEVACNLLNQTQKHWLYANDQYWKSLQPESNWYCFATKLGKQRPCISDLRGTYVDYNC